MKKFISTLSSHHCSSIKSLLHNRLYPQALKSSIASLPNYPLLTDEIYALFIKSGHILDHFLSASLLSHFSKIGDFSRSIGYLFDTLNPDIVTYNALLSGYARFGLSEAGFGLFRELRHLGLKPDVFTSSSLVKLCKSLEDNEIVHGVCFRMGFSSATYLVSGFTENYARAGEICSAEKCFEECSVLDSVVWTSMISGFVWNEEFEKGKEVFVEMMKLGFDLNEFCLTSALGAMFDVREGKSIHGVGFKMGLLCGGSIYLSNAVMNMYSRCGNKPDAVKVFDDMPEPDIVSWTERIGAARDDFEALELFRDLHSRDLQLINEYTVINVLLHIGSSGKVKSFKQIQALCQKAGFLVFISLCNSIISINGKCGDMDDARRVFDDMPEPDSVSWNSLIGGYSENGLVCEALTLFSQMRDFSLHPNLFTFSSLLYGLSKSSLEKTVMQIHSYVTKFGLTSDHSMVSCLITAYGKCNAIDESKRVFSEIDAKNVIYMNTMLTIFVQSGLHTDALDLFNISRDLHNHDIDGTSFSIAIKSCGALSDLDQGKMIIGTSFKIGFDEDNFVESAVIDMYCKCGCIAEAEKAFKMKSTDYNLAVWNAMITGYSQHGHANEVSLLFRKMSDLGIEPDEITFLGVLSAFRHVGLVKEARSCLDSMFVVYGVMPCLEHYACMVDLLGRVGLLEDAKRVIEEMPIGADAYIWQILLSACNDHGNIDMGLIAGRKLVDIQPGNESAYLLLSNLYAKAGMWSDVGKLRREMKEKVIRKEPGSSWIQVGRITHFFYAGDNSHSRSGEIYMQLTSVYGQILASSPR